MPEEQNTGTVPEEQTTGAESKAEPQAKTYTLEQAREELKKENQDNLDRVLSTKVNKMTEKHKRELAELQNGTKTAEERLASIEKMLGEEKEARTLAEQRAEEKAQEALEKEKIAQEKDLMNSLLSSGLSQENAEFSMWKIEKLRAENPDSVVDNKEIVEQLKKDNPTLFGQAEEKKVSSGWRMDSGASNEAIDVSKMSMAEVMAYQYGKQK